jgi:hypothetical protein
MYSIRSVLYDVLVFTTFKCFGRVPSLFLVCRFTRYGAYLVHFEMSKTCYILIFVNQGSICDWTAVSKESRVFCLVVCLHHLHKLILLCHITSKLILFTLCTY